MGNFRALSSSAYADKGVLWAENEEELIKSMHQILELEKPDINSFEGLSAAELALVFKKCYTADIYFSTIFKLSQKFNMRKLISICWT